MATSDATERGTVRHRGGVRSGTLPRRLLTACVGLALAAPLAAGAGAAPSFAATGEPAADAAATRTYRPTPSRATQDYPRYYDARSTLAPWAGRRCHADAASTRAVVCEFATTTTRHTIALVGDSKMGMYAPAFIRIAQARGWRVLIMTKSACSFSDASIDRSGAAYPACDTWNRSALKALERHQPDLVVTNQYMSVGRLPGQTRATETAMEQGLASRWRTVQEMGIPVVVVLDNPGPPTGDVYPCVAKNPNRPWRCSFSATSATAAVQQRAAARAGGVGIINLRPTLCPGGVCRAVFGDVLAYRQGSHLTNTYVKTITSTISSKLDVALRDARAR